MPIKFSRRLWVVYTRQMLHITHFAYGKELVLGSFGWIALSIASYGCTVLIAGISEATPESLSSIVRLFANCDEGLGEELTA